MHKVKNNKRIRIINSFLSAPDKIKNHMKRILLGDILTINDNKKKSYINYYVGDNTEEICYYNSLLIESYDFIEIESHNLETRETHYGTSNILTENEFTSIKGIVKFNI